MGVYTNFTQIQRSGGIVTRIMSTLGLGVLLRSMTTGSTQNVQMAQVKGTAETKCGAMMEL